jgi:hypothetical protein
MTHHPVPLPSTQSNFLLFQHFDHSPAHKRAAHSEGVTKASSATILLIPFRLLFPFLSPSPYTYQIYPLPFLTPRLTISTNKIGQADLKYELPYLDYLLATAILHSSPYGFTKILSNPTKDPLPHSFTRTFIQNIN